MVNMKNTGFKKKVLGGVVCGLFLASLPLSAQDTDNNTWMTVGVKHKLNSRFDLSGAAEWRTKDDVSETDRLGAKLGVQYKALSFLKLGAGYEFHYRNRGEQGWKSRHRYYLDGTLSSRWLDWKVSLRERVQHTLDGHHDDFKLRSRVKVAYDLPKVKLEPYLSVEMYNGLNKREDFDITRMRYRGGLSFPILDCLDMELFYCRQWEEKRSKNIYGIEASVKF